MKQEILNNENSFPNSNQQNSAQLNWFIMAVLILSNLLAIVGILYMVYVKFSWASLVLGIVWGYCCQTAISGGYHRLFSHRAYNCAAPLKIFYLLFGAASMQHTALNWCADHRRHHASTDEDADPYNITKGFWWAHMGWLFFKDPLRNHSNVKDLAADPYVALQHRYYIPIAVTMSYLIPLALGTLWGDPLGALFTAGFIRLAIQYQATFAINSVTHSFGSRPYEKNSSARDSFLAALLTMGEGYHNFHHRFPTDYRNGVRAHQFDPTKWLVWVLSHVGLTSNLRRVPDEVISKARRETMMSEQMSGQTS